MAETHWSKKVHAARSHACAYDLVCCSESKTITPTRHSQKTYCIENYAARNSRLRSRYTVVYRKLRGKKITPAQQTYILDFLEFVVVELEPFNLLHIVEAAGWDLLNLTACKTRKQKYTTPPSDPEHRLNLSRSFFFCPPAHFKRPCHEIFYL